MRTRYLRNLIPIICLLTLFGCGGGGGGTAGPTTHTTVSGVASKGIFTSGQVKVYALNADGSKGSLLKVAGINAFGNYSAHLGAYAGPVVTEASGFYTDEATGSTLQVTETAPLRAAIQNASGAVKIAITPLTEIAVQKATANGGSKLTVATIDAANSTIAQVFHVADILATVPVDVTSAASATATTDQKEYSLALAAVSQMMQNGGLSLATVVSQVAGGITGSGAGAALATATANSFQSALQTIAADPDKNKTGIADVTATPLINIGASTATVRLSTRGGAAVLDGIQVTLTLPAGVTIKAAGSAASPALSPLAGLVVASGLVPAGVAPVAHYTPAGPSQAAQLSLALATSAGFGVGEFATISCDVAPGVTIDNTSFGAANFSGLKVVDNNDATLSGFSVVARVN